MSRQPNKPVKARVKRMFGKRFKAGAYSAFAVAVVIAIAVVVNMLSGALPETVTEIDLTSNSLYSLSEQTKRIVSAVDKDVNLYLICNDGNEDASISKLLKRYESLSDHIKVTYMDPTNNPTFLDSYELELSNLYENSVLADCEGRSRLISYTDIYVTSYSMDYSTYNYSTSTSFNGESALTNAIHYVTSEDLPIVYTLSGHGESELGEDITDGLAQDNFETATLSLLTEESVPEDAGVIVIHAPTSDLSADEAEKLNAYLDNGGSIILITDYITSGEMTNLLSVAEHMGMTAGEGLIIEGDQNHYITRYPYYLLPEIQDHDITSALSEAGYYILMPLAQPIEETGTTSATVTMLLTTSESAYTKAAGMEATTVEQEDGDAAGAFNVGAASELGEARMVWFTSAQMLNESIDMTVSGANSNLFLNAVNWMCESEESISIRSKSMDRTSLTVTQSQSSFWSIVMIGLIPAAFIVAGILIYVRRKKR